MSVRSKIVVIAVAAVALAFAGVHGPGVQAQTPPAKEGATKAAPEKEDTKAKAAADRKAKADDRKAQRAEAKKERAEKKKKATTERTAFRERQMQCGAEWREARKAGKVEKNMTWPKFWSACNTRLKEKSA